MTHSKRLGFLWKAWTRFGKKFKEKIHLKLRNEDQKGPHLLRSWEPDGAAEGTWPRGVGEGAVAAFTGPAEGAGMLEDGFRM